ncbi:MAG: hypothetical protein JWM36_3532 [Hyphomicrobiales bacterium]|nr:hypothetical protein [Hyphomicrobiales bacterium]
MRHALVKISRLPMTPFFTGMVARGFGTALLLFSATSIAEAQMAEGRKAAPGSAAPRQSAPNHCARYGQGFVAVEGSDACVRIGGRLRIDVGRGLRSDAPGVGGFRFGEPLPPGYGSEGEGLNRAHIRVGGTKSDYDPITR